MPNWWDNDPVAQVPTAAPADAPMPLSGAGQMPPGATAGRMVAQPDAPDASMVPLSANAQRANKLMTIEGLMGDRSGVQSQNDILKSDPTYLAREAQAKQMGTNAAQLSAKQQAGTRVLDAVDQLQNKAQAWYQHAPDAFNNGIGPWDSSETIQNYKAAIPLIGNRGAQAFTTSMHHDIEKLVALYREMPSTGTSGGSDAQDANFKDAMGKWIASPDPDTAFAILQSAKDLVRNKSGLAPGFDVPQRPLDPLDVNAINRYAKTPIAPDSPYVTGGLKVGTVKKGYVYQGGAPSDPASWTKAQTQP